MATDPSELAIEREADLREQKKKILQRLKNSSTKVDELRGNIAGAEGSLFKQEFPSGGHRKESEVTPRDSLELYEEFANNSVLSADEQAREHEDSLRDTRDKRANNKTPAPTRRSRTYVKEDLAVSILIENTEGTQYVPSFASNSSQHSLSVSDYDRKTSEIRRIAEERRKNIMSPRGRSPNTLGVPFGEEDQLEIKKGPTRSSSLTDLCQTSRTREFHSTEKIFRSKSQMSERSETLSRANSAGRGLSSSSEDINLEHFARRQQEKLEDNLRRVERNLETTFSEMRKYIAAAQTETKKHLEKSHHRQADTWSTENK